MRTLLFTWLSVFGIAACTVNNEGNEGDNIYIVTGDGQDNTGGTQTGGTQTGGTQTGGTDTGTAVASDCEDACEACYEAWVEGCAACPNDPDCDEPGEACISAANAEQILGCNTCAATAMSAACDGQ